MSRSHRHLFQALTCLLLTTTACTKAPVHAPEADKPQLLARLYGTHVNRNRGTPPRSADELKAFAARLGPDELKPLGIDAAALDALFVSSRDHKPFVFRKASGRVGPDTVVLHEQEGVNGKRIVVFPMGKVEEADAARFKQLVPEGS